MVWFKNGFRRFEKFINRLEERYAGSFAVTLCISGMVVITAGSSNVLAVMLRLALGYVALWDMVRHQREWEATTETADRYHIHELNRRLAEQSPRLADDEDYNDIDLGEDEEFDSNSWAA